MTCPCLPDRCPTCRRLMTPRESAVLLNRCAGCAIRQRVAEGFTTRALELAKLFDYPVSSVWRAVQKQNEKRLRRETRDMMAAAGMGGTA